MLTMAELDKEYAKERARGMGREQLATVNFQLHSQERKCKEKESLSWKGQLDYGQFCIL